jgi:hypothetical protein
VESELDESLAADIRRMMIRLFSELKKRLRRTYKNNSMNPKRTWLKKFQKDTETTE